MSMSAAVSLGPALWVSTSNAAPATSLIARPFTSHLADLLTPTLVPDTEDPLRSSETLKLLVAFAKESTPLATDVPVIKPLESLLSLTAPLTASLRTIVIRPALSMELLLLVLASNVAPILLLDIRPFTIHLDLLTSVWA